MTMGDRIKTRQQLLDQQVGAESTRPEQAHDGTVTQVSEDGADAVRLELEQLHERMAVIKQEAAAEVELKWTSPWRTPEVFDLKVKTRLTSHQEYRSLQDRVRDAKASLAEFDAAAEAGTAK